MINDGLVKVINKNNLKLAVYGSRNEMGYAAAEEAAAALRKALKQKETVSVLFACAVSQLDFFSSLFTKGDIEWDRVVGFVMDEYIGLSEGSPYYLYHFADTNIFSRVNLKERFVFDGANPDRDAECERYSELLRKYPLDVACLGIGENGHLAYNDPHIADFNDPKLVKVIDLDEKSRMQAVHDGAFPNIEIVPNYAFTVTIPVMINAAYKLAVVPGAHKADAIAAAVSGPVSVSCPASILQEHECVIYTDVEGASKLK